MRPILAILIFYFMLLPAGGSAAVTWSGAGGDSDWFNPTNWSGELLPGATDDVFVVTNGIGGPTLTGSVAVLTLTLSNKTLLFQGTNTILTASNVTVAGSSGKITHSAQETTSTNAAGLWIPNHLVWIVCSNFDLASGAAINADGMGYAGGTNTYTNGCGPGGGIYSVSKGGGGGYGGAGGQGNSAGSIGGATNGSVFEASEPGSGGGFGHFANSYGGFGGGCIRIEIADRAIVDGTLSANAGGGMRDGAGGGAGGGIYLSCADLTGAGTIQTIGGNGSAGGSYGGGGGGGRIALVANNGSGFTGSFTARGGSGYSTNYGDIGTVYLNDLRTLKTVFTNGGAYLVLNSRTWDCDHLSVSNFYLRFETGIVVTVANDIEVLNGARVTLIGASVLSCANLVVTGSGFYGASTLALGANRNLDGSNCMTCTGSVLIGGGLMHIYPASSLRVGGSLSLYGGAGHIYPASSLRVGGSLSLYGGAGIYTYCHPTLGTCPSGMVCAADFYLGTGCVVSASSNGWAGGVSGHGNGYGLGPGVAAGWGAGGGGYGGAGGAGKGAAGYGGSPYGLSNAPAYPGSGGGLGYFVGGHGGSGGGYVQITVSETMTIEGSVYANGGAGVSDGDAGGAGGSIVLSAQKISGHGCIQADGGHRGSAGGSIGGGGGGGRIAVRCSYNHFYGTTSVTNGTGYLPGQVGTIFWRIHAPGTFFSVW